MPLDCKDGYVGIAKVIGAVVVCMVILTLLFASENLVVVERISGYLVVLGIVLGVFQYFAQKEASEKPQLPGVKKRR
ncbi:MAG: hypothetical protein JW727_03035 [Candidatus Aenigmarchaeota archaeon]|nr:hypothetical protein [Candidatus Aenigmarchaeota archaeon]